MEPGKGSFGGSPTLSPRLADQVFSRVAGAPLVRGNTVRLLRDAAENYPAWLDAISLARRTVHFENYIVHDDDVGRRFAAALRDKAREGVPVRVVYDWFGCLGKAPARFWRQLTEDGVDVRCYNPPRLSQPLGWIGRDHRKCLVVDGRVAFVTGLCVGKMWEGAAERGLQGWRDTGVEVRGPAVAEVARAFAESWAATGAPLPPEEPSGPIAEGDVDLRVVASTPGTGGLYRLDPLVASLARRTLWLTDAYFAGTSNYVQALRAAAQDGVDVRLLVPGAGSDVPVMQAVSRAGYRALLEAGVRVFEWNGSMLHAKTAVADARWARVGSTNLNLASWIGNRELDVVVENQAFGRQMEEMFEEDLGHATEIVLHRWARVRPAGNLRPPRVRGAGGSTTRAAAGVLRVGNALGSVLAARRLHGPAERWLMAEGGLLLAVVAGLGFLWPRLLAWPLAAFSLWLGLALLARSARRRPDAPSAVEGRGHPSAPAVAADHDTPAGTREDTEAVQWR
ncbi:MAG TPA: phospholipase D-like domain-containing protein [Vicinamibacteria bacterium]|nr:phospholipase D-like domain-containing protein [Vicinamibacteria bacterium]